ncbi:MAG: 3-oxoacyl-ACP synthase III [Planctomycetota bacterium]|nr:3-oxoacyl-ACP synthase III [Planctomycetota bacterium]
MKYTRVFLDAIGYELAPVVVTSHEIEERLRPLYQKLHIPIGQLESLTGIGERRWWAPRTPLSQGATMAARKALAKSGVPAEAVETLIYAGVCRENFEPATACRVASGLGVSPNCNVYDVSNACLGVLNGIIDVANRIELGQIRAGVVVSCETAREIVDLTIEKMLQSPTMEMYKDSLATLTGGSGAVALVLTDGSFASARARKLLGGVTQTAPEFHALCRWGLMPQNSTDNATLIQMMVTDSVSVLKHGVELGRRTFQAFLSTLGVTAEQMDKVICHQVGGIHRDTILKALGVNAEKDFSTFPYLGNIGTVSLPLTAALAEERQFLRRGDRVGFLGIGSGLNCLMLGWEW